MRTPDSTKESPDVIAFDKIVGHISRILTWLPHRVTLSVKLIDLIP